MSKFKDKFNVEIRMYESLTLTFYKNESEKTLNYFYLNKLKVQSTTKTFHNFL